MDITDEYRIPARRQHVWDALNDADVLKGCIPGCKEMEKVSDTEFAARLCQVKRFHYKIWVSR